MYALRASRGVLIRGCIGLRHASVATNTTTNGTSKPDDHSSQAQKLAQHDRQRIDRQTNEYSKSGTDDSVATHQPSASFDPSQPTDPSAARERVDQANAFANNPLDVSPANPTLSDTTAEIEKGGGLRTQKRVTSQSRTATSAGHEVESKSTVVQEKVVYAGSSKRKPKEPPTPVFRPGSR